MISVPEVDQILSQNLFKFDSMQLPLSEACVHVLREDLVADRDCPAADRVLMDGIAINFSTWEQGERSFMVQATQRAGEPPKTLEQNDNCIEVMTGSILPLGCDCVVPVEDIEIVKGTARLSENFYLKKSQFICSQGTDYRKDDVLVKQGTRLSPQVIAVAAAVGKATVAVSKKPKIAVIGTGDEIVDINQSVEPYQTRGSNVFVLNAALKQNEFREVNCFHLKDDRDVMTKELRTILDTHDVLILSGGVSMGKFDFVPAVLKELSVEILFHKVKQRPGKPFLFGMADKEKPVFGLPGNPVSTQICFYRYVLPYLKTFTRYQIPVTSNHVLLCENVEGLPGFTYFLPVAVMCSSNGQQMAAPMPHQTSGDYQALARATGFVELVHGQNLFTAGTAVPYFEFR
ncbi:MAG: molybdopterin molybdotransferase MoeA [Candidatus Omnitrophica bacterium]|nr:molybdopterin molybdotransferase MoeA [Candidatus Omnitrophota bacterium]